MRPYPPLFRLFPVKARLRSPGLETSAEGQGAHGGDNRLHGFEDFPGRGSLPQRHFHVGLDMLHVGPQGYLHHDLKQFLGLAVQKPLAGVRGLDERIEFLGPRIVIG